MNFQIFALIKNFQSSIGLKNNKMKLGSVLLKPIWETDFMLCKPQKESFENIKELIPFSTILGYV